MVFFLRSSTMLAPTGAPAAVMRSFMKRMAAVTGGLKSSTSLVKRWISSSFTYLVFLTSMRMDLTITDYPDRAALNTYMHGSAEAIGLRYNPGPRVEAFNISLGRPITIAVFQSADAP